MKHTILAILLVCAVTASTAQAATITGVVYQVFYGVPFSNTVVRFEPLTQNPLITGGGIASIIPKFTRANSVGYFSNRFEAGPYKVWLSDYTKDWVRLDAPDDEGTYDWRSLVSTNASHTTNFTGVPFELKVNKGATNGYAPLDANAKVPTNYLYMSLLGSGGSGLTGDILDDDSGDDILDGH